METETMTKLYLELSRVVPMGTRTKRELELEAEIKDLKMGAGIKPTGLTVRDRKQLEETVEVLRFHGAPQKADFIESLIKRKTK